MSEKSTQDAIAEVWQLFKETDARLDKRFAETDANLTRLEGLFTSQWGRMLEALVEPAALAQFQARGIDVQYTFKRAKVRRNGQTMELDLILENGSDIVVVEVKSTLKVVDVQEFLTDLGELLHFFPRYQGMNIYGAVAGLTVDEEADRFAYRRGLFVLGVTGDGVVSIRNDSAFQPQNFGNPVEFAHPKN